MIRLKNILITGSGSGLGQELSKLYSAEDVNVILVGRKRYKLEETARQIREIGHRAEIEMCNIASYEDVTFLKKKIDDKYGRLSLLINNAGIGMFGPIDEMSKDEINKMIDINVKGTIYMTQVLLEIIDDRVINIMSTAGLEGKTNESIYSASKFAVRGFTESLQREFEGQRLKFTSVYIGAMNTSFWNGSSHVKDLERLKKPSQIARMICDMDDGRREIILE